MAGKLLGESLGRTQLGKRPRVYLVDLIHVCRAVPFDPEWENQAWNHAAHLRKRGISSSATDYLIELSAWSTILVVLHCDHDVQAMKTAFPNQTVDWTG